MISTLSMNMTDIRKASKNISCRPNVHGIIIKKVHNVFTFFMTNWTILVRCFIRKNVYLLLCFTKDSTLYCNEHSKFSSRLKAFFYSQYFHYLLPVILTCWRKSIANYIPMYLFLLHACDFAICIYLKTKCDVNFPTSL